MVPFFTEVCFEKIGGAIFFREVRFFFREVYFKIGAIFLGRYVFLKRCIFFREVCFVERCFCREATEVHF